MIGHRLHYHRELGAARSSRSGTGLDFVRSRLSEMADRLGNDVVQSAVLVSCELLSNACFHTRGPTGIDLELDLDGGRLTISVSDPSSREPHLRPFRPAAPHGHGLHIINGLATAWGVTPRPHGKAVWATLAVPKLLSAALRARGGGVRGVRKARE
ncbi:ATP-binding protein [Streptomyces sp. NPDC059851]|uniref:ATP-binding protein n=1 Tax=Streptomyces sp. NPDC059851 TaxID=3346971 RepID=UPI003650B56A